MHASPSELRAVRRDGVVLHYAILGKESQQRVAYVLAEFPGTGSAGTFVEDLCSAAHWGFVVRGVLEIETATGVTDVSRGSAFHVPAAEPHRLRTAGSSRLAGFAPIPPGVQLTDQAIRAMGYEVLPPEADRHAAGLPSVARTRPERPPGPGEVLVETHRMGDLLYTRTRLGRRAGYVGEPCDVPHWGLVVAGSVALEWEDDVELLGTGDVFLCHQGPPAHRIQAAEPAVVVDFTPVDAFLTAERIAEWRRAPGRDALAREPEDRVLDVLAL